MSAVALTPPQRAVLLAPVDPHGLQWHGPKRRNTIAALVRLGLVEITARKGPMRQVGLTPRGALVAVQLREIVRVAEQEGRVPALEGVWTLVLDPDPGEMTGTS